MNTANWIPDLFMKRMEARGRLDPLPRQRDPRPPRALRQRLRGSATSEYESSPRKARSSARRSRPSSSGRRCSRCSSRPATLGSPSRTPATSAPRRTTSASSTAPISAPRSRSTPRRRDRRLQPRLRHPRQPPRPRRLPRPQKLRETIRMAVRALDNVIDINFYPTEAAKTSNSRHRPIGLGVMGLQHALYQRKGMPSPPRPSSSTTRHGSHRLLRLRGLLRPRRRARHLLHLQGLQVGPRPPPAGHRRPPRAGTRRPVEVPRGGKHGLDALRAKIAKQGMRNSNVLAIAPTATISNITATSPASSPPTRTSSSNPTSPASSSS
jgi:ribonucleoside-diphosphate reductase alpha chain